MKTSQTIKNNNKITEIVWNLVIVTFLCINAFFIVLTSTHLFLNNIPDTFWHDFFPYNNFIDNLLALSVFFVKSPFPFFVIIILTCLITSPIHELGHAIAILAFKPKLEVKWYFSRTICNWEKISDATIPIIAVAGIALSLLFTTMLSIPFYFLGFKMIRMAIIAAGNLQLLVNMLIWKFRDGYPLFHPLEFKSMEKEPGKILIHHFNKPKQ